MDSNAKKRDLIDELFIRYKQSYELTLETEETIGPNAYLFILEKLTSNLKADIKGLGSEMKYYNRYCNIERKHDVKLRKLNFKYISDEEYVALTKKARFRYKVRKYKFEAENRRFERLTYKFMLYLPDEFFYTQEEEIDVVSEEETDTQNPVQDNVLVDTALLAPDTVSTVSEENEDIEETSSEDEKAEKEEEEKEDEQLRIKLEDFFDNQ